MLFSVQKEIAKKSILKRNKPLKVSSLPEIQIDKLLVKSTYNQSIKKDIIDGEINLSLTIKSNSSRYKCDEPIDIRSPTVLNDSSHILSSQKSSHINQNKNNISRLDFLSKLNDDKPNVIKIMEELADVKHQNVKQCNEIIVSNQIKYR